MKQELVKAITVICGELFDTKVEVELSRPDEKFGDYASSVALKLAGKTGKNPREIAEQIADKLRASDKFKSIEIAGPGFINFTLKDEYLFSDSKHAVELERTLTGQSVVAEYSDPNPFKVLHAGHLYTSVVGDAISNILETAGAKVHRVNYGGDVGLHVAKTLWAAIKKLGVEDSAKLAEIGNNERAQWLAERYVEGTNAYEENEQAKAEIGNLNKKIYDASLNEDKSSELGKIYWQTRQWSYDYFEEFYARLGIKFEKYYPESTVAGLGLETVKNNTPKIYSESEGAIVYKAEKLHTRVFITREGLPTYEAKEVGLILQKDRDYGFDKSIVITANEQDQYMQVVLASIQEFQPELVKKTTHLTHGMVKLRARER